MLNKNQQKVVNTLEGPILCLAGAGSGKTHTVIHRIVNILNKGTKPEEILLLTFTNKAAREMLERVDEIIGKGMSERITGSTYHSFCAQILRKYGNRIGVPSGYTIMTSTSSKSLVKILTDDIELLKNGNKQINNKNIAPWISKLKNGNHTFEENLEMCFGDVARKENYKKAFRNLYEQYESYKKDKNILDFDDLLIMTNKLLRENTDICKKLSDQYKYIMVDEYQDSNAIQLEFLKLLRQFDNKNICVVGDDTQCIYGFRGSNFDNILNFSKDFPGAEIIMLTENYRSSQSIVDAANVVALSAEEGYHKKLTSARGKMEIDPRIVKVNDVNEQTRRIVKEIEEKIKEGAKPSDFGILSRTGYELDDIQFKLQLNGIPCQKYGGMSFFEREHVANYIAMINYISNTKDTVSLMQLLQLVPGIGGKFAISISDEIFTKGEEAGMEKFKRRKFYPQLEELIKNLNIFRNPKIENLPIKILDYLNLLSYQYFINSKMADDTKHDNIERIKKDDMQLRQIINSIEFESFEDFRTQLSLGSGDDINSEEDTAQGKVTLSTVHSAKGLEWKYLYVINAIDGRFPMKSKYQSSSPFIDKMKERDFEEERRIFYVAISRARDELTIFQPMRFGFKNDLVSGSPFLQGLKQQFKVENSDDGWYHE